jgi:hypothetical protein
VADQDRLAHVEQIQQARHVLGEQLDRVGSGRLSVWPWPRRSGAIILNPEASAGTWWRHETWLKRRPWIRTIAGPLPLAS